MRIQRLPGLAQRPMGEILCETEEETSIMQVQIAPGLGRLTRTRCRPRKSGKSKLELPPSLASSHFTFNTSSSFASQSLMARGKRHRSGVFHIAACFMLSDQVATTLALYHLWQVYQIKATWVCLRSVLIGVDSKYEDGNG